jgi:hypothetical protein
MEELRERKEFQKGTRRSTNPESRFGGRGTAIGVNYEENVGAMLSVKMLAGSRSVVWEGIAGDLIDSITMQSGGPVDDILVRLRDSEGACVFISAKQRSSAIPLTARSPAFTDTVRAFVRQSSKLSPGGKKNSRFLWAIPSTAGRAAVTDLRNVLDAHRANATDTPLLQFVSGRGAAETKALKSLLSIVEQSWSEEYGSAPSESDLKSFLGHVYVVVYDFGPNSQFELGAEGELRTHVLQEPGESHAAWETLLSIFRGANQRGLTLTAPSLRKALSAEGFKLRIPADYEPDISKLREVTARNLQEIKDHSKLRFGERPEEYHHIERQDDLSPLLVAAGMESFLITGEPGCGKSGLIFRFVEELQKAGVPVVLLLAEKAFAKDQKESANVPGLTHSLDDVLSHWPEGGAGVFVTDALDAIRDPASQKAFHRLLQNVKSGSSHWRVVASVREFDLKFGRELRELFPGRGIGGHATPEFENVAHFHLGLLTEPQLDVLVRERAELLPFVRGARQETKAQGMHRSPFYLRLAAELLRNGVGPERLADWNSPAVLLRSYWDLRVNGGAQREEHTLTLKAVCEGMVNARRTAVSTKELSLTAAQLRSIEELRSRGVLQSPPVRHGTVVASDDIRFTHHLLHDYAISRTLIPESPREAFCAYVSKRALISVFYRQSLLFALEALWDVDPTREAYWNCALELEGQPAVHAVTRVLAPILGARRVEVVEDLKPLAAALTSVSTSDSAGQKALLHLASGINDVSVDALRVGAMAWSAFAMELANLLPAQPHIEGPLAQILFRLDACEVSALGATRPLLNTAARALLANHVAKIVGKGWRPGALIAIKTICRTFDSASEESERALLSLLTPERLVDFPHHDLYDLADNLIFLGAQGDAVVLRLFEAAFADEPKGGDFEEAGSLILRLQFQKRDSWHMVQYALATYYEKYNSENSGLMTDIACIAWNSVARKHGYGPDWPDLELTTIEFRGVPCKLTIDYSHIYGRAYENEENRILTKFENALRQWATAGDMDRLSVAIDHFARRNRTALMWSVMMEIGAEHPKTLGALLSSCLEEPTFLANSDYSYGGVALLGALHRAGTMAEREHLETLILKLPQELRLPPGETRESMSNWIEHVQNRLLGVLEEPNIVVDSLRELRSRRSNGGPLPANQKPTGARVSHGDVPGNEVLKSKGIDLTAPASAEMLRLQEDLKPLLDQNKGTIELEEVEKRWPTILEAETATSASIETERGQDLWGHLVSACENIARCAGLPKTDERWRVITRILLKAASDPVPAPSYNNPEDDDWPSWGWPSPRLDAAKGLPFVAYRTGKLDREVTEALRKLATDPSHPLRFNLADRLAVLHPVNSRLMWELIDIFVARESMFSVLDMLLRAMSRLPNTENENVALRLREIARRVKGEAPTKNPIHETLANINLFRFLRTGDAESKAFVAELIDKCDEPRNLRPLQAQLHSCRSGGWLTAGDSVTTDSSADEVRHRTWQFFSELLATAQERLRMHCGEMKKARQSGRASPEKALEERKNAAMQLVDAVGLQLYFASGAFCDQNQRPERALTPPQLRRFWNESKSLLEALAAEPHPHVAHQLIQTFTHLLPCAPSDVFMIAAKSIHASSQAGFQHDSLAVTEVVKLIQRALADHRDIFREERDGKSECLAALLKVLDLFVEAGWPQARQLTHHLEEIYR